MTHCLSFCFPCLLCLPCFPCFLLATKADFAKESARIAFAALFAELAAYRLKEKSGLVNSISRDLQFQCLRHSLPHLNTTAYQFTPEFIDASSVWNLPSL